MMHREVKPHAAINTATLYKTEEEASVAPTNILQVSVAQYVSMCRATLHPSLHIIVLCMWLLMMLFLPVCLHHYGYPGHGQAAAQHVAIYCREITLLLLKPSGKHGALCT